MQVKLYDREFNEFYYVEREYLNNEVVITFNSVARGNSDYNFTVEERKNYRDDGWCHGCDSKCYIMTLEEIINYINENHFSASLEDILFRGMSAVMDATENDFIDMMKVTLENGYIKKAQWVYFDDFTEYTNIPQ